MSLSQRFWAVWEKIWWLVGLLMVAGFITLLLIDCVLLVRLLGGALMLGGGFSLLYASRAVRLARRSLSWPAVEGLILTSKVDVEKGTYTVGATRDTYTEYYPNVEFEYQFQGMTYRSRRILFVTVNYRKSEAEAAIARYPAGTRARVFVNPRQLSVAVLEAGLAGHEMKYVLVFVIGAALFLAGLAAWHFAPLAGSLESIY
jgi:hypothetical protein